jgi:hypothetical protein
VVVIALPPVGSEYSRDAIHGVRGFAALFPIIPPSREPIKQEKRKGMENNKTSSMRRIL